MIRASLSAAARRRSVARRPPVPPPPSSSTTTTTSSAAPLSSLSSAAAGAPGAADDAADRRRRERCGPAGPSTPPTLGGPRGFGSLKSTAFPRATTTTPAMIVRPFSAEADETTTAATKKKKKKSSLEDTVNRLKSKDGESAEEGGGGDGASSNDDAVRDAYHRASAAASSFLSGLSSTWRELVDSGKPQSINKVIHEPLKKGEVAEDDDAAADKYEGTTALMTIDPEEHLTAWERMQRRLSEAPIIQDILGKSHELYEKSGAKDVKRKVDHLSEDAREAWETSQNPWVYRVSSVYDTLTAESEYAIAVKELRKLDPDFTLEEWKRDVVEHTLPEVMALFLEGRIKELQPWLGESVYNRLAAEMRARKKEGVYIDTHVLGIMNSEILACEPDTVERGSPIILLHYMCQQINCVRKKESDEVVEGSEDEIRANSYVAAFQREYDEENGALNWKIVDFRFNGAIAYL